MKLSLKVCGISLLLWIIFLIFMFVKNKPPTTFEELGYISLGTLIVIFGPFLLCLIGFYSVIGNKGALRLALLISFVWAASMYLVINPPHNYSGWRKFLGVGIIPVAAYLGLIWVFSGFNSHKKSEIR